MVNKQLSSSHMKYYFMLKIGILKVLSEFGIQQKPNLLSDEAKSNTKIYFRISILHLSMFITCHLLGKMTVHTGSRNCHKLRPIVSISQHLQILFQSCFFICPAVFPAMDTCQLLFSYWFKILRKPILLLCLQIFVAS